VTLLGFQLKSDVNSDCGVAPGLDVSWGLRPANDDLSEAGGFELLRSPEGGGKRLDVIAAPESGYTVAYLRAVVHHAKIYIRPMQRDLCLDPVKEEACTDPPKEPCLKCGALVTVMSLREHMVMCKRRAKSDTSEVKLPEYQHMDTIVIDPESDDSPLTSCKEEMDPVLEVAIHLSKGDKGPHNPDMELRSIVELIKHLQQNVHDVSFDMVVRRSNILSDALRRMERATFDPKHMLNVVFVGEEGSDTGGLTREFFRLVSYALKSRYITATGCFRHDAVAYQDSVYFRLGLLAAMSLVHGGASFRVVCPTVFRFLSGKSAADLIASISEVDDPDVREILKKVYIYYCIHNGQL
jgi:hypothetical protein